MWSIEIAFKYSTVISRLMYNTKEEAEAQRDKLAHVLGKERDYGKNAQTENVRLTDKFGDITIAPCEVKAMRCLDADAWDDMVSERNNTYQSKLVKAP